MQAFSRLTETFTPKTYSLSLTLNRTERTFTGLVTIQGRLLKGNYIPLHAKDLVINSVTVDGHAAEFSHHEHDELHINSPDFENDQHIVVIDFNGKITDAMHGLYPCYYEIDGKKHELLATQFESHHAREVFPCVDEPAGKATFDLTLTTEDDITVLGNMPIKNQEVENNQLVTTFETSPVMSPYLLAWVTGDLQKKTATSKHGVEVNVYSTKAQPLDSLDFALEVGTKVIDFYSDYFGVNYPLPKCDHVALPDFSSGAMENWGLITYREIALLASKNTSIHSRRYIATVIAHELSHQWFGNLVTMKWWDDLWLNESFATSMEYLAIDALYPEWNIWRDFSAGEAVMALRRDSLDGVQSVHVDVNHPDEISTLFDGAIVYAKGARLLRMVQHFIGDKAFQTGLKSYFKKYAYQNTIGQNLWDELSAASGEDVSAIMETWVGQSGFPVVSVDKQNDKITLSQKQFFVGPHKKSDKLWPVPLNATDTNLPTIFHSNKAEFTSDNNELLRLNNGDSAHFITHYSAPLMEQLLDALANNKLSEITRLQLLHEQTLLVKAGIVPAGNLIPLLQAYRHETNENVWNIMSLTISELRQLIDTNEAAEKQLKQFVAKLAHDQYERLGWTPTAKESEDDTNLRSTIIGLMLYAEHSEAIATAHDLFTNTKLDDLDPELRGLVISNEVRHFSTNNDLVSRLLEVYKTTSDGDIRDDIASGLTNTRQSDVVAMLLATILDGKTIRAQDVTRWYAYLVRNRYGREQSWQWLRDNWQWIEDSFRGDKSIDYYPRYTANALNTTEHLVQYSTFFTPLKADPTLERAITIGEGEIQGRVDYIEHGQPSVIEQLNKLN